MIKKVERKLRLGPGHPIPLGSTILEEGVNFAVFSRNAEKVSLLLFETGIEDKWTEVDLDPAVNCTGDVWHILIRGLDKELRYGFRMQGPYDPAGTGHFYSPEWILLDPYAKALTGGTKWGEVYERRGKRGAEEQFARRSCLVEDDFDWEGDRPLGLPLRDTIIYELHVRGFTRHPSSGVVNSGTYAGLVEKIPYLKDLGINAVELLPVTEFNENENIKKDPVTGEKLKNYWGYSPLAFFAPKASYAVDGRNGKQVREFKEMVKALHKAGIEVILDIVFNHSAEGGADGPIYSFRGIDNTIYYLLGPDKEYLNFSGCGNTLNCNHPVLRNLILDCLRYWVAEMHVDGFRFDLASVFARDKKGEVLINPPVVEHIAEDPVLTGTKIIAEAWDATGLYQVGGFSSSARWAEWNGKYRDDARAFIRGNPGTVPDLATRIAGSSDLYQNSGRKPYNSINFLTSHDGFTLYDLMSYNKKHNYRNGEDNRDGEDYNISWNSGVEGETDDHEIMNLRFRRIKTAAVILFLSQGTPMFVAGDEFARTQFGNNNAFCQDNEISWLDWSLAEKNRGLFRFFRMLIRLRHSHSVFRRRDFFPAEDRADIAEIQWQRSDPGKMDWSADSKSLAFFLDGRGAPEDRDDNFFIMLNCDRSAQIFHFPSPGRGRKWYSLIDTKKSSPQDFLQEGRGKPLRSKKKTVDYMSAAVLVAKKVDK
ncbi:MAG: glycogen debranching protein GlgX [Desulfurivibrionaceae bacterium]